MAYCAERDIPVDFSSASKKSPYSMDANLLHISYEGGVLEDLGVPLRSQCGAGPSLLSRHLRQATS